MNKEPQDIIKFSSRSADGHYLQMTFDGTNMSLFAMMLRFENFLRGMGYVIQEDDYDAAPTFEGPVRSFGDPVCSDHPDAPHGFDRSSSHSSGRYVCDCEGWKPDDAEGEELPEHEEGLL